MLAKHKSYMARLTFIFTLTVLLSTSLHAANPKEVGESPAAKTVEADEATIELKKVRGFVVDEFGEPMVGVVVNALGSDKATITDTEGKYTLMALDADILKFTQLGMADKEEKITSSRIVNVSLVFE